MTLNATGGPTVVLPAYHPAQAQMAASGSRFTVLAAGRRCGKTTLAIRKVAETALAGKPAAWGGPTYKSVGETWRIFTELLRPVTKRRSEQEKRLELTTRGVIDVWSLEEPDVVRGRGYKRFVVDEAAAIPRLEYAWQQVIRPTLTDDLGDAWFLSTPKGRNYFWDLYRLGTDPAEKEWVSHRLPSSSNPYLPPGEIAAAKASLPARVFAQEYEADFVSDDLGVFRRVEEAARAPGATAQEKALPGHTYVAGLDFGRYADFTVCCVLDVSLDPVELVAVDRFNQTDWQTQWTRIQALSSRFRPAAILAERNAAGEPVLAVLRMLGLPVVDFVTSNPSKAVAVQALALALEQEQIRLLDDPVLLDELASFEATRLPGGMIRYAAPEGKHDDQVIALCLSWLAATQHLTRQTRTAVEFGGMGRRRAQHLRERLKEKGGWTMDGHERRRSIRSMRWAEDFKGETALAALGIPLPAARCLYAAGYRTRQDIEDSPDRELLLAPGIGPARLASIRAAVPYDPQWEAGEGEAS